MKTKCYFIRMDLVVDILIREDNLIEEENLAEEDINLVDK